MQKINVEKYILPTGTLLHLGAGLYQVTYTNPGKYRVSLQMIGLMKNKDTVILMDGNEIPLSIFEQRRREDMPRKHEVGRNPKNVSLDVHPAAMGGNANFKKTRSKTHMGTGQTEPKTKGGN